MHTAILNAPAIKQTDKQKMHLLTTVHNIHNTEAKGQKQLNKHLPVKQGGRQQCFTGTLEAKTGGSIFQAHVSINKIKPRYKTGESPGAFTTPQKELQATQEC